MYLSCAYATSLAMYICSLGAVFKNLTVYIMYIFQLVTMKKEWFSYTRKEYNIENFQTKLSAEIKVQAAHL